MFRPTDTLVELEDVNGEWWDLTNGDKGVYLATGVTGIYDPPVKVVMEEPGNWPGARYLNHRVLRRDVVFGVEILDDEGDSWLSRDSEWRKAWSFDRDCKLYVTTPESGTRYLKLRLFESPTIETETDPRGNDINRAAMVTVAGDPFWYGEDEVYSFVTQTDTTFDPNPLPWPWPQEEIPVETINLVVDPSDGKGGLNPTDNYIYLKWTVPGSTQAPSQPYIPGIPWLGAPNSPANIWILPDYKFEPPEEDEPDLSARRLRLPGLIGGLRTEEVQAVFISGKPTSGNFKLGYDGVETGNIAWNASNGAVKAALEALASIAFNDVLVERASATNETQVMHIEGGPTGGTFKLTFNGEQTAGIPFNATAGTVRTALAALPGLADADVAVTAQSINEVQVITPVGEPTAGTFKLTFDGETTAPIPWDATAAQVQSALQALPNIGDDSGWWFFITPGDISVTKASGQYQPWKVTFRTGLAGINLEQITADPSGLTGGAGIDIHVETETQGTTVYLITFQGAYSGFDLDLMTADDALLTGGSDPTVIIDSEVEGSRPYLITFTGNLSGLDVPLMTVNTAGLSGGGTISGRAEVRREGLTAPAENVVVDTDPRVEQVTSESGSQVWARMNGVRFRHPVPPYTKSKTFQISVAGCEPGQMGTLRIPRPWTRPWGLE